MPPGTPAVGLDFLIIAGGNERLNHTQQSTTEVQNMIALAYLESNRGIFVSEIGKNHNHKLFMEMVKSGTFGLWRPLEGDSNSL